MIIDNTTINCNVYLVDVDLHYNMVHHTLFQTTWCTTPCFKHHSRLNEVAARKKRKDYAFRRQFNEKPIIIPGCPGRLLQAHADAATDPNG